MKIYNNGTLVVLLNGKPTLDPKVENKVKNALEAQGIKLNENDAVLQTKLNGIDLTFQEYFESDLALQLDASLEELSKFGIAFCGELEYHGDYKGYIVADVKDGVSEMDEKFHDICNMATEDLIDIIESRGLAVVRCSSPEEAHGICEETKKYLKNKLAAEVAELASKPMKSKKEMIDEAANNRLE